MFLGKCQGVSGDSVCFMEAHRVFIGLFKLIQGVPDSFGVYHDISEGFEGFTRDPEAVHGVSMSFRGIQERSVGFKDLSMVVR